MIYIFHHNDMDGRGAAHVVRQYEINQGNKAITFHEVDYIMDLTPLVDNVEDGSKVYFVDYSFKENTCHLLDNLINRGCDVVWIDHHTSSINLIEKQPKYGKLKGYVCDGISGAALAYMYLYGKSFEDIPEYLKVISDYDCWKFKYGYMTKIFKIGLDAYNQAPSSTIWNKLSGNMDSGVFSEVTATVYFQNVIDRGDILYKFIERDYKEYREQYSYETEIGGFKCLAISRKCNSWIFGEKYDEYDIVMTWGFNGKEYSYSIYSSKPYVDCCAIAKSYGGGGHKGAAGFKLSEMPFKKIEQGTKANV